MPGNNSSSHPIQNQSQALAQQRVLIAQQQQPVSRSSKFSWVRRLVARRTGAPLSVNGESNGSNNGANSRPAPAESSVAFRQPEQRQQNQRLQEDGPHPSFAPSSNGHSTNSSMTSSNRSAHPQQQQITTVSAAIPAAAATVVVDDQSSSHSSLKRRSNSNFTVPSISRTSITTLDTTPSLHGTVILATTATSPTQGPILLGTSGGNTNMLDTASIVTLASSSKRRRRRSFDTNASTRGIAPESIRSRRGSLDSLPLTTATIRSVPRFQALDLDSESEATTTDDEDDEGGHGQAHSHHSHAGCMDNRSEVLSVNTDYKVVVPTASS